MQAICIDSERLSAPFSEGFPNAPAMKLYDSPVAPNPRRVRIFLAEKGISVPIAKVDLAKLEHKTPEFAAVNPLSRIPTLVLDNGEIIAESIAICRYFEEIRPEPPLFGRNPLEKARVEMWQRHAELEFFFPITLAFRHSHPAMVEMEKPQIAALVEPSRARAIDFARFLNGELADRRGFCSPRAHRPSGRSRPSRPLARRSLRPP